MDSLPYVCNLSPELQEIALKELNEDPERRSHDIEDIRKWLQTQNLTSKTDNNFILRFLRVWKFDLKNTKNRIRSFYNLRNSTPEWFTKRDPLRPEIQELLDLGLFLPLHGYDKYGRRVGITHHALFDPNRHSMEDLMKVEQIIGDIVIEDEQTQICGVSAILDLSGFTFSHFRMWNFSILKKQITVWQKGNPVRLKSLNFINEPSFYGTIFQVFKYFFNEKLRKRIHFHGKNLESLHAVVPSEMLPEEYGGTAGKRQDLIGFWKKEVVSRRQELINNEVQVNNS